MTKISAKTYLSNLTIPGASSRFLLKPVGTVTITFDELCEKVAERSGLAVSTVKYALESSNQKMIDLLAKNNPVHAVLTPEGDIVDTLKAIEVENVTVTVAAILNEIQQSCVEEMNTISYADVDIVANGRKIAVDAAKADEGVWLANRATGAVVKTATILSSDSARCVFRFSELPEDGQYDLVIATRNNESGMDVVTVTRVVTVKAVPVA